MKALVNATAVSMTTDCWTSCHTESFITLTVHFIDEKWKLRTLNLNTEPFNDRHTSANLHQFLSSKVEKWCIVNKVAFVVSDNASNILGALRMAAWDFMGCCAHKLNLIVQNSLTHIEYLRTKVRC